MVRLRLVPVGKSKQPSYRIVASDSKRRLKSEYLWKLGNYNPTTKEITIDKEKALFFLSQGAKPTLTTKQILSKVGILQEFAKLELEQKNKIKNSNN